MLQNKLRYLVLVLISMFLAILYNQYFMGILFLTVVILPFVLFAILSYVYGKISLELVTLVHVANKEEDIPISIQVNNPSLFPISNIGVTISYRNTFSNQHKYYKQEFNLSIDGRSSTTATCNLKSSHAGNLDISLSKVRVYDYLKIFSLKKVNLGQIKVAVLPSYYELTEDYFKNRCKMQIESDYYSAIKSGDDPSEVFTIREYREGDRPQRIHWKLSLKQDQLMIKDFSDPLNCSVVVIVDLGFPKDDNALEAIDGLLECALSLSYSFMLKGQIHYLTWYDKVQEICKRVRIVNEKDLFEAVDGLLNCLPYTQGLDMTTAYYAEYPNDQYTDLFYVTRTFTQGQLDSLLLIKAVDRQILFIDSKDNYHYENEIDDLRDLPITNDLMEKLTNTGIGLLPINSTSIKRDLEGLKLD